MNIITCIKQVPASSDVQVDEETGVLKRDGAAVKLNPYDLYALELAFTLAKPQDKILALTMGPPQAKAAIEEALCMGAHEGAVLSDRRFAGADVLATSRALANGVQKLANGEGYGLVLCGKQTTDGDTAQVGAEMAEFLGIAHIANVEAVLALDETSVTVRAQQDALLVTATLDLPCLLCTDGNISVPRLPSYQRKMALKPDAVRIYSLDDLSDSDPMHYGQNGSPTQVVRIFPPEKSDGREMLQGDANTLAEKLHTLLAAKKFL